MYGHDPLLLIVVIALVAFAIGWIQHRHPAIGAAIDLSCKVVLALIAVLVFVFITTKNPPADQAPIVTTTQPPAPASGSTPTPDPGPDTALTHS
ncbi:hypothetical protein [Streptomyces sp. SAS_260]|uniref:hypothetical protein n=1 Tax=Streptomyces sp. SAS_260 TaxID=3412751 RepID=UPI00403D11C8